MGADAVRKETAVAFEYRQRHRRAARLRCGKSDRNRVSTLQPVSGRGLSKVAGKVFRIGHIGDMNELMLLGAIAGAEMAMGDVGIPLHLGSGVAAVQTAWKQPVSTESRSSAVLHSVAA